IYFNRYSSNLLLFNSLNITVYGAFVWVVINGRPALQASVVLLLIALTFVLPANNWLLGLPGVVEVVQLTRLLGALSLILIAFLAEKKGSPRLGRCCIVLGVFFGLTALLDFSWGATERLILTADKTSQLDGNYRTTYDLANVKDQDIVLV